MPLNDNAYTIPSSGYVGWAPPGTPPPADADLHPDDWAAPWSVVGHVGTEENDGAPEISYDGGDLTAKGSWSKRRIRTVKAAETEAIAWSLSQIDKVALGLYFGGTGGATAGRFQRRTTDADTTEHAMLIVWLDGDEVFGVWYDNVSTKKGDSLDFTDNENPVMLPLSSTVLDPVTGTLISEWISTVIGS